MKFYSEKTKKFYETMDKALAAEKEFDVAEQQKIAAQEAEKKRVAELKEKRASRAKEIEELLKLVEGRIDNVESDSTKTAELVNKLSEKVTRIEGDFVTHDELKDAVDKILGSEELDEKLDTIDEIQKWINEHTDLLGTLSEISEKICLPKR